MNFHEWAKSQEAAGLAEVYTLTELKYAEIGEGPWKLHIHHGGPPYNSEVWWFRKKQTKHAIEEIALVEAKKRSDANIAQGLEVKVCDGGDELVFHSESGVVLYGEGFWEAVTK
jgi:hypothetical protein